MAKKNFKNIDPTTENRSVNTADLPWTDTFNNLDNWGTGGTLVSGEMRIITNSEVKTVEGGWIYGDFDIQMDVRTTDTSAGTGWVFESGIFLRAYDSGFVQLGFAYSETYGNTATPGGVRGFIANNSYVPIGTTYFDYLDSPTDTRVRMTFVESTQVYTFYGWNVTSQTAGWYQLGTSTRTGTPAARHRVHALSSSGGTSSQTNWIDDFTINSIGGASAGLASWTDDFPALFGSAVFYDKFDEGTAGSSITAVDFSIPYVDNFTTDPTLNTYNYDCSDYNHPAYGGFITYSEANDRMEFDFPYPPGQLTGYWTHNTDFAFSGDCECEWEYTFGPSLSAFGTTGIEVSARSPSELNGVRFYVGQSDGRVFRRYRTNGSSWSLSSTGLKVTVNDTYGFRLRRSGHVIIFEYSLNGGAWTEPTTGRFDFTSQIGVGDYSLDDWRFYTYAGNWSTTTAAVVFYYNSFKINSASPLPEYVPAKGIPAVPVDFTENWWTIDLTNTDVPSQESYLTTNFGANSIDRSSSLDANFKFGGDFDIQVDYSFDTLTAPSSSVSYACLIRLFNTTDTQVASISRGIDIVNSQYFANGTDQSFTGVTTADTSGKLRMVRVSGEITVYYWSGSQWEWNGDTNGLVVVNTEYDNLSFNIYQGQRTNSTVEAYITNFVINSCDEILWPGGTLRRAIPRVGNTYTMTMDEADGSTPDPNLFSVYGNASDPITDSMFIQDGVYKFEPPFSAVSNLYAATSTGDRMTLTGDFEVIIEFNDNGIPGFSASNSQIGQMTFLDDDPLYTNGNLVLNYQRYRSTINHNYYIWSNNPNTNIQTARTNDQGDGAQGKMRIHRIGEDWYASYWNYVNNRWEWNGDPAGRVVRNFRGTPVTTFLMSPQQGIGATLTGWIDNVQISADTITWSPETADWIPTYMNHTTSPAPEKRLFTFPSNNTFPDEGYWTGYSNDTNAMRIGYNPNASSTLRYQLQGDFEVKWKVNFITWSKTQHDWQFQFRFIGTNGSPGQQDVVYLYDTNPATGYDTWLQYVVVRLDGGTIWNTGATDLGTDTWSRCRRVGNNFYLEYSSDGVSGWTEIYGPDIPRTQNNIGDTIQISFSCPSWDDWAGGAEEVTALVDNFEVVSGTIVNDTTFEWTDSILENHIEYTYTAPWTEGFTGTNGDIIDTNIWTVNGQVTIQSNGAQMYYPGSGPTPLIISKFQISGDFDIETDISSTGMTGLAGDEQDVNFRIDSVSTGENVSIQVNNKTTDQIVVSHSVDGQNQPATWTDSDISLRFTRVGTLIRIYYKTNASGTWIAVPDYNYNLSGDVTVKYVFWYGTASTTEWTGDIDSLTINSGTIDWNGVGNFEYVGATVPYTPIPSAYTYFNDTYTDTSFISIENHTPNTHPADGYYTTPVAEIGAGTIRITTGGNYMEANTSAGTSYMYCYYEFGETISPLLFDWSFRFAQYSAYTNGGVRTSLQNASGTTMVGMWGHSSTTQVRCYYPGGNALVTCGSKVDNFFYDNRITYDGSRIRFYSHGEAVYSREYTGTMDLARFYFWGVGTSTARRGKWDDMNLYIHGLKVL